MAKNQEGKQNLRFQKQKSIPLHHSSGLLKCLVQTIHPQKQKCQQEEDDVCSSCQRVIEMMQLIMCTSNNLLDEGGLEEVVEEQLGFEALEF
jgi:hypothetical protein